MAFTSGKADNIVEDVAGCGRFQLIMTLLVMLVSNCATTFSMNFMAFGSYNPGWRCNDNPINASLESWNQTTMTNESFLGFLNRHMVSINIYPKSSQIRKVSNLSATDTQHVYGQEMTTLDYKTTNVVPLVHADNETSGNIKKDGWYTSRDGDSQCRVFEKCRDVVFNPDAVTIVTEWSLICNQGWVSSFITSIQMVGVLFGCVIAGHCGDRFGRKRIVYSSIALNIVVNVLSVFSPSWQWFTVFRFLLGICVGACVSLYLVYVLEFLPKKWRIVGESLPCWTINSVFTTLVSMTFKDWRYVQITTAIIGCIGLLPAIWLPESLRWLEVKNRNERFKKEVLKVVKMNGGTKQNLDGNSSSAQKEQLAVQVIDTAVYDVRALFKKEYRNITFLLSMPWLVMSLISYGIFFGVRALHGDFFLDLILFDLVQVPFCVVPMFTNLIGRRRVSFLFGSFCGLCFIGAAFFEHFGSATSKLYGVSTFVFAGVMATELWWILVSTITIEVYPTIIRSLGIGWCNSMARVGGMLAPFVIPSDPSFVYISYFLVGSIAILVSVFIFKLPETNNVRMKDVYEVDTEEQNNVV